MVAQSKTSKFSAWLLVGQGGLAVVLRALRDRRGYRADMSSPRTAVFIDHNVWDPVFLRGIDLRSEFPVERYGLAITREGQFEIPLTPEPLRTFIEQSMKRWEVGVDVKFGFWDARHVQEDQRVGGFGFGVWHRMRSPASTLRSVAGYAIQSARRGCTKTRQTSHLERDRSKVLC